MRLMGRNTSTKGHNHGDKAAIREYGTTIDGKISCPYGILFDKTADTRAHKFYSEW